MISIEQINGEIAVLEDEKPTHVIMQKLAALYTVRDHIILNSQPQTPVVSVSEVVPPLMSESKFADKISGKNIRNVMGVIDELMDTLLIVNPRLYEGVMAKL